MAIFLKSLSRCLILETLSTVSVNYLILRDWYTLKRTYDTLKAVVMPVNKPNSYSSELVLIG